MENKTFTVKDALFVLTGAVTIICMVLNWFPVELNLGVVQFNEVFGKINAITLSKTVFELEEALGALAGFLPQAFEELKTWSVVMTVCAAITVALYASGIVMRILRKERFVELVSLAASAGAVLTAVVFYMVITEICDAIGVSDAGYSVMPILMKSPWLLTVLAGVVSACCTKKIAEMAEECMITCIKKFKEMAVYIAEWIRVIMDNLGFLISDVIGAGVGIMAGKAIASATSVTFIGVVAGMGVACFVAAVCCMIANKMFVREKTK